MDSLHARLLAAASLVLTAFLGLTGWALDQAFRASAETAAHDRLKGHIYALLAATDLEAGGFLDIPDTLPEARFSNPDSGLYAQVVSRDRTFQWRSTSMLGFAIPFRLKVQPGAFRFDTVVVDGRSLFTVSFGVVWENERRMEHAYTFSVAESSASFRREIAGFRRSLWGWLGGLAAVLLLLQGSIVRWGMAPLRWVAADLRNIESGRATRLEGHYPRELRGLTDNLNALIAHNQAALERYRNALADLAHSLKTPLAVLQGLAGSQRGDEVELQTLRDQVRHMNQIVEYQLQRAATSGRATLSAVLPLKPVVNKVVSSLAKVYADKAVRVVRNIPDDAMFYGDQGDLVELLGNLLDNAHKWCRNRVELSVQPLVGTDPHTSRAGLELQIDDDGPGIASARRPAVLERGVRADSLAEGQGIGLAVVRDIVDAYQGSLSIEESSLGGARVRVRLPAA